VQGRSPVSSKADWLRLQQLEQMCPARHKPCIWMLGARGKYCPTCGSVQCSASEPAPGRGRFCLCLAGHAAAPPCNKARQQKHVTVVVTLNVGPPLNTWVAWHAGVAEARQCLCVLVPEGCHARLCITTHVGMCHDSVTCSPASHPSCTSYHPPLSLHAHLFQEMRCGLT
jgi:hypothetical protein